MRYAEQSGWLVLTEQFDDPLCSGIAAGRSALSRLLQRVRAGEVDVVLVWCITRLSRSVEQGVALRHELREHGVELFSASQGPE
jgi:site-specific DNA recombinase